MQLEGEVSASHEATVTASGEGAEVSVSHEVSADVQTRRRRQMRLAFGVRVGVTVGVAAAVAVGVDAAVVIGVDVAVAVDVAV